MDSYDLSIIGKKFQKLTVISRNKKNYWNCICDCGNEIFVSTSNLKRQISCGCHPRLDAKDLLGRKFEKLTIISIFKQPPNTQYLCKCDCGNEKIAFRRYLLHGQTISCGCIRKSSPHLFKKTHGLIKTKAYQSWQAMKNRCLNKNNKFFKNWGGRGITICNKWLESFENFFEDMGDRPKGMSLERIDNNKGYYKDNCKWIPKENQSKNRRGNIYLNINGEILTARETWIKNGKKGCYATFILKAKKTYNLF